METIYNTKFIQSGDRLEIYKYRGYIRKGGESKNNTGRKGKKEVSEIEKEVNRIKSRNNTLIKARNKIIRIAHANKDMNSFITLTYKEDMKDIKKSKRQLNAFFQKLKEDFEDLKYLYVIQFQSKNRDDVIHYHILTNFPIDCKTGKNRKTKEQKEYERKFSRKYWRFGFVDCRNLEGEGNTNIGKYISAYLTADMYKKNLNGMRVFAYSRNADKPIITTMETKYTYDELSSIEGYNMDYTSTYDINYHDKSGKHRFNTVNYFDYRLKE